MLTPPLQTIKQSFSLFFEKKNLINFVKIYSPLLPFSLFSIWQNTNLKSYEQLTSNGLLGIVMVVNLAYLIVYLWIVIAGIIGIQKIVDHESINVSEIYKKSWKLVWKFSLLSLLVWLTQLGGAIFLIYPGLVFAVWYGFAKFVFIEKDQRIINAFGKSRNLVQGRFWAVAGRELVFVIFTIFMGIVFAIIPFGIGGVLTTLFGALFVIPFYLLYRELVSSYKS